MRTALLLAVALTACSDPTAPDTDGGVDSIGVDASPDAEVCGPVSPLPREEVGQLPMGAWNGAWTCIDGCDLERPALTLATRVELGVGAQSYAEWRNGPPITRLGMHADGNCWVIDADNCQSAIEICAGACGECAVVSGAAWSSGGRTQHWRFVGTR